jgi:hypothetical protein
MNIKENDIHKIVKDECVLKREKETNEERRMKELGYISPPLFPYIPEILCSDGRKWYWLRQKFRATYYGGI